MCWKEIENTGLILFSSEHSLILLLTSFDAGKALFDIERLLSLKKPEQIRQNPAEKIQIPAFCQQKSPALSSLSTSLSSHQRDQKTGDNPSNQENPKLKQSWRFFDPLSSPQGDDELIRMEALLEEKAQKANRGIVLEAKPDIIGNYNGLYFHLEQKADQELRILWKHVVQILPINR